MKSENKLGGKKMSEDEEWEEMEQAACASLLGPPPPPRCIHSLFFFPPWRESVCVCERLVIPIRGFVFFLHYLSSLSSQQFYFQPIIIYVLPGVTSSWEDAPQTHLWIHSETL